MFTPIKNGKYWALEAKNKPWGDDDNTIDHVTRKGKTTWINFKTKTKALECTRELNKSYWKIYAKNEGKARKLGTIADEMVAVITKHLETV